MSYNHACKAGNRADVWKHFWLCEVVNRLRPDSTGCVSVLDTHCGAGLYNRHNAEQWDDGIGRFAGGAVGTLGCFGRVAAPYLQRNLYLGSWLLAAEVLKRRNIEFRIHGCDVATEAEAAFRNLGPEVAFEGSYQFTRGDGYAVAARGEPQSLVFLDPPYSPDAEQDWQTLARLIPDLKSSADVVAVWYPIDDRTERQLLLASCSLLRHEVSWEQSTEDLHETMTGCGFGIWAGEELELQETEQTAHGVAETLGGTYATRVPGDA